MLITGLCSYGTPVGVTELILITDLCAFRTPVGVTDLILYMTYTYNRLTFIRDSHRSYRTYPYSALILIQNLYLTDLCLFKTPVGVIELMLMLRSLTYSEVPVGTTEITERVLVLQNLFLY